MIGVVYARGLVDGSDLIRGSLDESLHGVRINAHPAKTASAKRFADFMQSNGVDVVGQELTISGPLGVRRYDIVTRNADGTLHGIEIKTGGANKTPYQAITDMYVNLFSATGLGKINGQIMTGTSVIYLPGGC